MGLKDHTRGNDGGSFLKASDIKNGTQAKIIGPATYETHDFGRGRGEEEITRMPMIVEGFQGKQLWNPGTNAKLLLLKSLGENDADWKYPVQGKFERREIQTNQGPRLATMFVPNSSTLEQSVKPTAKEKEKGKYAASFMCRKCGAELKTSQELSEHVQGEHMHD